ncbi:MAG TPA: hypothetical protein VHY37_09150 [Tepidisphaeraceae bacterium]|jgi:hypothetical protein|nr:hypothetical protein [Tepidisphaeraceae bacterium]
MGHRGISGIGGTALIGAAAIFGGCASRPAAPPYPSPPPPAVVRDAGLPANDLQTTADHIAASLLADPKLNAGKKSWTLAVDRMEDDTAGSAFSHDYDLLLERLRAALFQQSNGRVQLIEKRAAAHDLSVPASPSPPPGPIAPPRNMQPDYLLSGMAADLPDRGPGYFQLQLKVTDAKSRAITWTEICDVFTGH